MSAYAVVVTEQGEYSDKFRALWFEFATMFVLGMSERSPSV